MPKEKLQNLLIRDRNAVHSFCPYRVCPLGAHVDHQNGFISGFAIDHGITFDYLVTDDGSIEIYSDNYDGACAGNVDRKFERQGSWVDFVYGSLCALKRNYPVRRGLRGIIAGSLPVGGLSSSASVILTYLVAFCRANDIEISTSELIQQAIYTERTFIGVNVGKLDQSCEVYCRKDNLLFMDTLDDSVQLLPVSANMPPFEIAVIFSGLERKLAGSAYNMRVDECKAAAYALKAYAKADYGKFNETFLRDVPKDVFLKEKDRLPENWRKRAEHYYGEIDRVNAGVRAWNAGDIAEFGRQIFASGASSISNYETGSEELQFIQNLMVKTDGVYGGRFSGAGFNGCSMAIVDPAKKDAITRSITEAYVSRFPSCREKFSIHYCKTADGISFR